MKYYNKDKTIMIDINKIHSYNYKKFIYKSTFDGFNGFDDVYEIGLSINGSSSPILWKKEATELFNILKNEK